MAITQRIYPNFVRSAFFNQYFNETNEVACVMVLCDTQSSFNIDHRFGEDSSTPIQGIIIGTDKYFNVTLSTTASPPDVEYIRFVVPSISWGSAPGSPFRYGIIGALFPGENPALLSSYVPFMHFDFETEQDVGSFTLTPSATCKPTIDFTPTVNPVCAP
jgi:hypothetical protein